MLLMQNSRVLTSDKNYHQNSVKAHVELYFFVLNLGDIDAIGIADLDTL